MVVEREKFAHCRPPAGLRHRAKMPFRPTFRSPPGLRERLGRIRSLDEKLDHFILRGADYMEVVAEAWSQNFHASTALEGNPLSLDDVRQTTRRGIQGEAPEPGNPYRQEIYQHLVTWTQPDLFQGTWSVDLVRWLHRRLAQFDHERPGHLRNDYERIQVGNEEQVWFEGAPGIHVHDELAELLRWLNEEGPQYDPLVAASLFFHEFESIHPFEDGNGRTGRVLFHAYLQENGLPNAHKCMIERVVTADPDLYYRVLAWADHEPDGRGYTELVDFFVDATLDAYEAAVERFGARDLLTSGVDENKKRILIQAKRQGDWFDLATARDWVDGRSDPTLRSYLKHWEDEGAIETQGRTSDRRFRFVNPLRDFMEQATVRS